MSDKKKRADLTTGAVSSLEVDGIDGVIYYLPMSIQQMIDYQAENEKAKKDEASGGDPRNLQRLTESLARQLCDEDGNLIYTYEQLARSGVGGVKIAEIFRRITGRKDDDSPNPSSEAAAPGSASPTESLPS